MSFHCFNTSCLKRKTSNNAINEEFQLHSLFLRKIVPQNSSVQHLCLGQQEELSPSSCARLQRVSGDGPPSPAQHKHLTSLVSTQHKESKYFCGKYTWVTHFLRGASVAGSNLKTKRMSLHPCVKDNR